MGQRNRQSHPYVLNGVYIWIDFHRYINIFEFIAYGIKCWVCRSNVDPKCADPFDNTTLPIQDCNEYYLQHLKGKLDSFVNLKAFILWKWFYRSIANPLEPDRFPITDAFDELLNRYEEKHGLGPYGAIPPAYPPQVGPQAQPQPTRPGQPKLIRATMCRKIRQKVQGNWRTIRSCAFLGSPGDGTGNEHHCRVRHGTHDIYIEYCTCNSKDGCNAATTVDLPKFLTLALLISTITISTSRLLSF